MSYTYYGLKPPSYPLFKLVEPKQNDGKPRFREWGRRDPVPITLTLATERCTGSTPLTEPELYQPTPQRDTRPVIINRQTARILEANLQRQRKGNL